MIDDTDKRETERVAPANQLRGAVMVLQPMTIVEISHNGALIETPFRLQLDSLHEFRLSLGERSVVLKGRIVHCFVGEVRNDATVYRSGIEFVEPSEPVRQAITAFVDMLTAARRVPAIVDGELAEDER
jgi:hypothetical protein